MNDDGWKELHLWPNYGEGKVGFQIDNMERKLIDPDTAREKAARLEQHAGRFPPRFRSDIIDQAATLRRLAAAVDPDGAENTAFDNTNSDP